MHTNEIAAIAIATVLGLDALIHAYWLTGRTWPARDPRTLSKAVLNVEVPFTPRVLVPLIAVLAAAVTVVLAKGGLPPRWLPVWIPVVGTYTVMAGLLVRGAAGIVWVLGFGAERGTAFYRLNLFAYTPLCLLLGSAAAVVAVHR